MRDGNPSTAVQQATRPSRRSALRNEPTIRFELGAVLASARAALFSGRNQYLGRPTECLGNSRVSEIFWLKDLMCHHYVTTFTRSELPNRLCRPRRRGRSRSLPIVRDRRAHLLDMSIHGEHPTSPPTDGWGLEPLMDVHELAAYLVSRSPRSTTGGCTAKAPRPTGSANT